MLMDSECKEFVSELDIYVSFYITSTVMLFWLLLLSQDNNECVLSIIFLIKLFFFILFMSNELDDNLDLFINFMMSIITNAKSHYIIYS